MVTLRLRGVGLGKGVAGIPTDPGPIGIAIRLAVPPRAPTDGSASDLRAPFLRSMLPVLYSGTVLSFCILGSDGAPPLPDARGRAPSELLTERAPLCE